MRLLVVTDSTKTHPAQLALPAHTIAIPVTRQATASAATTMTTGLLIAPHPGASPEVATTNHSPE